MIYFGERSEEAGGRELGPLPACHGALAAPHRSHSANYMTTARVASAPRASY